jgi:hypothetical protein
MKRKSVTVEKSGTRQEPRPTVKTLDELLAITQKEFACVFKVDGHEVSISLRRLAPAEEEAAKQIIRQVEAPPVLDKQTGAVIGYNEQDPKYRTELEAALLSSRAFVIYHGCPEIKAKRPDLKSVKDITEYVQGILTDTILATLCATIQKGGFDLADRVNFSSKPDSES